MMFPTKESSNQLFVDSLPTSAQGQRAFIGKSNIDINDLFPSYKEASMQESYQVNKLL